MKARTLIAFAVPLAWSLLATPDVSAADSARLELLAAAGSSQAVPAGVNYRHDDGRHGKHARHGGRGHGRSAPYRHDGPVDRHGGHGYRGGYDHGHYARQRAHEYATAAVEQSREARALGYYSDHPRWGLSYYSHFEWALQADPHRVHEEIRRRARKLRELRSYDYGYGHRHGPHCRH